MPVPSLFEMAKRKVIRNIKDLEDVGDLTYKLVRPIILKVENPAQLHRIEKNCPHIADDTGEIWLRFIHRDFQNADACLPAGCDPETPPHKGWYWLYRKIKKHDEDALRESEAALRAQLSALQSQKEANTTRLVEYSLDPKRTRVKTQRAGHGSALPSLRGLPPGKAAIIKARREAIEAQQKRAHAQRLAPPRGVTSAPIGMVDDHKRPPPLRETKVTIRVPRLPTGIPPHFATSRQATHVGEESQPNNDASRSGPSPATPKPDQSPPAKATDEVKQSPPPMAERVSLPPDTHFRAPPMRSAAEGARPAPLVKRKRPASSIFMPAKKR